MPTILIVEDNEMNMDMLSRRLAKRGFDVLAATDGAAGVEAATVSRPDLILMDMSLPVMDGWEATRRLKASPDTYGIPVIALTAHAVAGDEEKCRAAGCDDYETKPVKFPQLMAKIDAILGIQSGGE
jgi:two-component system cell cycle response regulator DivK